MCDSAEVSDQNFLTQPGTWDLVADGFDRAVWDLFGQFGRRALDVVAPPPSARIIDIACGSGSLTIPAAGRVREVVAVDFSPRMVDVTRRRVERAGLANVAVDLGDGQALRYENDSFDAAFSLFGLMFFPARERGLSELLRVLKRRGHAVISSWPPLAKSPAMAAFAEAFAEATGAPQPDLAEAGPLGDEATIRREAQDAGFEIVAIERFEARLKAETFEAMWELIYDANVFIQNEKRRSGTRFETISLRLAAALRRRLGEPPYDLPLPALLTLLSAP